MTQTAFAELVGIEKSRLSKSLRGTRKFSSLDLAILAEAGGVTADWLLGIDTETAMAARSSAGSSAEKAFNKALQYVTMRSDLVELGYEQQWRLLGVGMSRGKWVDQGADLADQALKAVRIGDRSVSRDLVSAIEKRSARCGRAGSGGESIETTERSAIEAVERKRRRVRWFAD